MNVAMRMGRWIVGSIVLGAGMNAGVAVAQNVTIPWPTVSYKGAWEGRAYAADSTCSKVFTVPSGPKLRVTTILLDSYGSTVPVALQYLCTGTPVCSVPRSAYITAPAGGTLSLPLTSGILVNPGETLSVCNYGGIGKVTAWSFYGFFYQ